MKYNYPDIYFEPKYGEIYEKWEKGKAEQFIYEDKNGVVYHQFIKRKIDVDIDHKEYFDIITPYGYGGPIILELNSPDNKEKVVKGFGEEFKVYCKENNIVSEFIRFHPIINNAQDFIELYDPQYMRNTLASNMRDYDDPIQSEFSSKCRKTIRRAHNAGYSAELDLECKTLDSFRSIYYSTMDRKNATDYYYFDEKYFNRLVQEFGGNIFIVNIRFEGEIICSGLYMVYGNYIHAHLSGTKPEHLKWSPANLLSEAVVKWGKDNNKWYFHRGGGLTNSKEDTLYKFKKTFSQNTEFEFYIGKKIWNTDVYVELSKIHKLQGMIANEDFFPLYRSCIKQGVEK